MKIKIKNVDYGCGLRFDMELQQGGADEDRSVMEFFDERVRPIAEQQNSDKIGRSFLYACAMSIGDRVVISFSEQVEHAAIIKKHGRNTKAKVIEIEV